MMLLLCLPICLFAEPILRLWLGEYPEYTVIFLDEDLNYRESITFYQFVKASGTLECKDFFEFLKKQGIFNKKIKAIHFKPIIEKYWNKIKNNCDFRE